MPIKSQTVFELQKDWVSSGPWSAFAPMPDEEAAEWGL
jgi:hypothetical protein